MLDKIMCLDSKVELSVPATREMMLVIRLTSAAVLARAGVNADKIDELKMAIEESAACLIKCTGSGQINVTFKLTKDNCMIISLRKHDDRASLAEAMSGDEVDVMRCILATLTDSVNVIDEDGRVSEIELNTAII